MLEPCKFYVTFKLQPEYHGHREICTKCIKGWRWIITTRGYASIVLSEGDYVFGTVYELSLADVQNLNHFEGVVQENYRKEMITIEVEGRDLNCLVYIDQVTKVGKPKEDYISRINNGIKDAGFPDEYVTRYLRPFVPTCSDV